MWKISVPTNDIAGLKKVPAEIEVYKEIDVEQGIRQAFGDDLINNSDNIQVFMGKSVTTDMEKMMKKIVETTLTENKVQVQDQLDRVENSIRERVGAIENKIQERVGEIENKIQERIGGIENKIHDLANIVESKSLDRNVDKELWAIEIGDELWVKHPYRYNNDNSKEPRKVKIGCAVTNISSTRYLTVVLLKDRKEQKIISSLLSLEKWLLDCDGVPIMYRNETDRQLHAYIFVKRREMEKTIQELYKEFKETTS